MTVENNSVKRLLMVSTSYPSGPSDWRGLFIRNLAEALARRPEISLRLWSPPGIIPANSNYVALPEEADWLSRLVQAGGIAQLLRTGGLRGIASALQLVRLLRRLYVRQTDLDVYHVNWLQNALALPRTGVPLLTTVLGTDMQILKVPGMTALLRRVFKRQPTVICPNAEWMVAPLAERFGDVARIKYVPFGIDPRWFSLKREITETSEKWLCVSRVTRGKIGRLFEWTKPYFSSGTRELHLLGPIQDDTKVPEWVRYHGPVTPDKLCDVWFPKAHGLISLSEHSEGRPQVMLEAMASGLPIIASSLPAHTDLLKHRTTGWICERPDDLSDAFRVLSVPAENEAMGRRAQSWVSENIGTWDDCVGRYAVHYHELIGLRRK